MLNTAHTPEINTLKYKKQITCTSLFVGAPPGSRLPPPPPGRNTEIKFSHLSFQRESSLSLEHLISTAYKKKLKDNLNEQRRMWAPPPVHL